MNELCGLFSDVAHGTEITFEKNKTYHVCEDDSFILKGYFCTNTAKKHENPDGTRKSAIYLKINAIGHKKRTKAFSHAIVRKKQGKKSLIIHYARRILQKERMNEEV